MPGLADVSGARVLAEIGRFAGRSRSVVYRKARNQRLAASGFVWAFSALVASPGGRAHDDRRRAAGDRHDAAQRHLFNRLIGGYGRVAR